MLELSSDLLPAEDRFEVWRDVVTRKLMRMAIDPLTNAPFRANAKLRSQHGLTIGVGEIGPSLNHRTSQIVATDNDDFVLLVNLDGPFVVMGDGDDLILQPGDATLITCAQTGRYLRPSAGRMLCARLPRSALAALAPEADEITGRLIPGASAPLRLLLAYADALWGDPTALCDAKTSRFIVDHICDLVALTIGARGEAAEFAAARGGRAAKLKAIKDCIAARIGPSDLSIEDVAGEVGVSTRYVRKLLEAEGQSFSRYVAERRLGRARAMLTSPRHANLTVASIAYEVGFGDLSYFNRVFRRVYDRTPSDVRAEAV
jgi:AraC-like DNA-binding protein